MTLESEFHQRMLDNYRTCGEEFGYWAHYFLREVKRKGGLRTVQRMLLPKKGNKIDKGLQTLIDAGRTDLSVEAAALDPKFRPLFTAVELAEAERRLQALPQYVARQPVSPIENHPEDLDDAEYIEGAVRTVKVNQYERDNAARTACIKRHGVRCTVCKISFEERYGAIGRGFIHVHHKKPLALKRANYKLKPSTDLVPVCPNCHAMLHTQKPPLGVDELQKILHERDRT